MLAALLPSWILLGLLWGSPSGLFEGYHEQTVPTGRLLSRGWSQAEIEAVARLLPRTLSEVEARLGRRLGHVFTAVLAPDLAEVRRIVEAAGGRPPPGSEVLGVALPDASLLVIRGGYALGLDPSRRTLAHEVAHLVIHAGAQGAVPRWLDEGAAMWASGESLSADDESYLSLLARMHGLYSLDTLTHRFPEEHLPGSIAYQQSFLLVCFLEERFGRPGVSRLLELTAAGGGPPPLEALSGLETGALEEQFRGWVAARRSVARAIGSILNVWTLSAVLAVVAIVRYIRLRRRKLRAMEENEQAEPALGAGMSSTPEDDPSEEP